jgi:hypothetical protein
MKKLFVVLYSLVFSNYLLAHSCLIVDNSFSETDTLEIKTLTYSNSTIDSSAIISIDYPQISGLEDKSVETKVNLFLEEEFKQSIAWFEEVQSDSAYFEEFISEMQYTFETGYQVEFNSSNFVSIVMSHYQFTGGAHGNYFALGYNIQMKDGKVLALKDIIKEDSFDLLVYECEQVILEKYEANTLLEAGLFEDEIELLDDQDFYITPGMLILQFDPYEIGPWVMGEVTAEIPFEKIKDILKENLPFPTN